MLLNIFICYPVKFEINYILRCSSKIRNEGEDICIDSMGEKLRLLVAAPCHEMGGNQVGGAILSYYRDNKLKLSFTIM